MRRLGLILLLLLSACGLRKDPGASSELTGGNLMTGVEAFEAFLYPLTASQCSACHGAGTGPQFASASLFSSYQVTKNYVNFSDVPSSRLVGRTQDGHCGSNCDTDGSEMVGAIRDWWNNGEKPHSTPPPIAENIETDPIPVPTGLPTGTLFSTMSWDLDGLDPSLAGVKFTIEIQAFNADGYRVRNPKLITKNGSVSVRGIRLILNGIFDPANNAYEGVEVTAAANMTTTLSANFQLMLKDLESDQMSVRFDSISTD